MNILLISCLPIGHTGYGNQSLFLYNNLKDKYNFTFYAVDINIEEPTTIIKYVKNKNNAQYINFLINNPEYKMDNIKIYGRKKKNRSDYKIYEIWYEFEEICSIENIDLIFTICDIHAFGDIPNIKIPKIISWLPIHNDPLDLGTKIILNNIDYVASTSLWGKNIIYEYNENVEYIPHEIDNIFYNKISNNEKLLTRKYLNIPSDYFCCLFIGRNTENTNRKQFQRNILAFKKFKEKYNIEKCWLHLHTNIKGSIDFSDLIDYSYMSVSDQEKLFRYEYSKDDIRKLYQMSDLLICLSGSEGFGLPILEAQLSGIPVIGTNCTAITENIYNGLLVNCINIENNNIESWSYADIDHAANCIFDIYSDSYNNKIIKSNISRDIISNKLSSINISNRIDFIIKKTINLKKDYIKCVIANEDIQFLKNLIENSINYKYLFIINPLKDENLNEIDYFKDIEIDYEKYSNILLITVDKFEDIYFKDYYYHYLYSHIKLGVDYLTNNNLSNNKLKLKINKKKYSIENFIKNDIINYSHLVDFGEIFFTNHLLKIKKKLKEKKLRKIRNNKNCKYNAIFIDRNNNKYFEIILLNLIFFTNEDIGFQIFYNENNKIFFKNIIQENNLKNILLTKLNYNVDTNISYSKFMLSDNFFSNINSDKILIYNTNTLLLKNFDNNYFRFDWIGAIWNDDILKKKNVYDLFTNKIFIGSGNFNIRSINKCKEIYNNKKLSLLDSNNYNLNEDIIYSFYLQEKNAIFPELNEAGSFAVESVFNPDPMAIDNSFFYFSSNQIEVNYLKFLFNNHYQKLI